jgi:two-component system, LuxR family, response regulator FixJ
MAVYDRSTLPRCASIAVVDDDAFVRRALERLLRAAGYRVSTHASGAEFLRAVETSVPACVLLDVHMPGLTGFDVLQTLRDMPNGSAVLLLTADHDPRTRQRALALGATACLLKPFDDALLLDTIAAALGRLTNRGLR